MTRVLVLNRNDVNRLARAKDINNLTYTDFLSVPGLAMREHDMVIFMDTDGSSRILKNRYV